MWTGVMKTCAICKKEIFIGNVESWTYKKDCYGVNTRGKIYFCGWNCMREYEKQYPEPKPKEWWEE